MLITLHSNGYEVAVNTMGAELKSFKDPSGKEYVWNSDPAFWMRSSPLLFPTIGNLRNGETTMKGQVYPLVKHGFCKDTEFEVKDLSDDTVTFLLHANEETLKSYPYQFELSLTYHLSDNELSMEYRVVNHDTEEMFYHIGAHPGFMLPVKHLPTVNSSLKKQKISYLMNMILKIWNSTQRKRLYKKQRATHYHLLLQCLTVMLFSLNTPIPIVFPSLTLILEKV